MRSLRNLAWFIAGVFIAFVWLAPSAFAQVPIAEAPFSPYPPQYNPYLPHPATGAPSLFSQATSAGVNATASGTAQVTMPSGLRIPVPVANTASVSKAAIANAGRVAVRALGPIGAAATAYEIYKAIQESGVTTCAPPDFFCKSDVSALYPQTHYCYNAGSNPNGTNCGTVRATLCSAWNPTYVWKANTSGTFQCIAPNGSGWGAPTLYTVCPSNYSLIAGMCSPTPTIPEVPMTDADIEQTLQQKMDADFNFNRRLYDSLQRDIAERGLTPAADPITPNTPVSVVAPPVTTSERTVSTTQTPRPDGSTDTTTVKETTTVNPTTTGNTQGTVKTTYPSTTTQTTTVTNNVTNNTSTSTTVVNNAPVEPAGSTKLEIPNDYNKEVTQQKIAAELAGDGAPALPDMRSQVTEHIDKNKTDLSKLTDDLPTQFATDKEKWFSWVWTPPVGECTPSSGNVHGVAVSLDICPTVLNIREALGWLFALFGAWTIYLEIFKRPV